MYSQAGKIYTLDLENGKQIKCTDVTRGAETITCIGENDTVEILKKSIVKVGIEETAPTGLAGNAPATEKSDSTKCLNDCRTGQVECRRDCQGDKACLNNCLSAQMKCGESCK